MLLQVIFLSLTTLRHQNTVFHKMERTLSSVDDNITSGSFFTYMMITKWIEKKIHVLLGYNYDVILYLYNKQLCYAYLIWVFKPIEFLVALTYCLAFLMSFFAYQFKSYLCDVSILNRYSTCVSSCIIISTIDIFSQVSSEINAIRLVI
jgi:hypothetical protein